MHSRYRGIKHINLWHKAEEGIVLDTGTLWTHLHIPLISILFFEIDVLLTMPGGADRTAFTHVFKAHTISNTFLTPLHIVNCISADESNNSGMKWSANDEIRDYTYDELLSRVFEIILDKNPDMAAGKKPKFVMRPPQVLRVGTKKTSFANFTDICRTLHR